MYIWSCNSFECVLSYACVIQDRKELREELSESFPTIRGDWEMLEVQQVEQSRTEVKEANISIFSEAQAYLI